MRQQVGTRVQIFAPAAILFKTSTQLQQSATMYYLQSPGRGTPRAIMALKRSFCSFRNYNYNELRPDRGLIYLKYVRRSYTNNFIYIDIF